MEMNLTVLIILSQLKAPVQMATLMDVLALGSLLGDRREANSSCYKPLFPTRYLYVQKWFKLQGFCTSKTIQVPKFMYAVQAA